MQSGRQSGPDMEGSGRLTFSVVVPTLDRPEYLDEMLISLVKQRFPKDRFEVIVVDDGGVLPAKTVAARFENLLSIAVIEQKHAGPAAARNTGAANCRAPYIAFIDDDCCADPEWLEKLEQAFATARSPCLFGGAVINATPENVFAEVGELILSVLLDFYRPEPGGLYFFRAANLAISCSDFRQAGGFDVDFRSAEDREFCDRWLHIGGSLIHVPGAIVSHRNRLSFGGFCRQHFNYGKGAYHFHRLRRARKSGGLAWQFLQYYLRVFRAGFAKTQSSGIVKVWLLLVWQVVNAAGFIYAWLDNMRARKKGTVPCQPDALQ